MPAVNFHSFSNYKKKRSNSPVPKSSERNHGTRLVPPTNAACSTPASTSGRGAPHPTENRGVDPAPADGPAPPAPGWAWRSPQRRYGVKGGLGCGFRAPSCPAATAAPSPCGQSSPRWERGPGQRAPAARASGAPPCRTGHSAPHPLLTATAARHLLLPPPDSSTAHTNRQTISNCNIRRRPGSQAPSPAHAPAPSNAGGGAPGNRSAASALGWSCLAADQGDGRSPRPGGTGAQAMLPPSARRRGLQAVPMPGRHGGAPMPALGPAQRASCVSRPLLCAPVIRLRFAGSGGGMLRPPWARVMPETRIFCGDRSSGVEMKLDKLLNAKQPSAGLRRGAEMLRSSGL